MIEVTGSACTCCLVQHSCVTGKLFEEINVSSSICSSVPSILRNSRYRRDQRQLEEEEEMWFNEDDDFDDGEAMPASNDILGKKQMESDLDTIGNAKISY